MGSTVTVPDSYLKQTLRVLNMAKGKTDGDGKSTLNLNALTNVNSFGTAFFLFKCENLPALAGRIDGTEGEASYERVLRAYKQMGVASRGIIDSMNPMNIEGRTFGYENIIWTKFYSDYILGTENITNGQVSPALKEQYIRGAPSIDEADYELDKSDNDHVHNTPFGLVHKRTLAQLAPVYVKIQTFTLKLFAMRHAIKLQTGFIFVMFRIVLPFFVVVGTDQRLYHDPRSCRSGDGNEEKAVACYNISYLKHETKYILFTILVVLCDIFEIVGTMQRWNQRSKNGKNASCVVLDQHREFLNNYMSRFLYTAFCVHYGIIAWYNTWVGYNFAFAEFNEQYCTGEDRERRFCYRWNKQNAGKQ